MSSIDTYILLASSLEYLEDKDFTDENTKVELSYLTFFFYPFWVNSCQDLCRASILQSHDR